MGPQVGFKLLPLFFNIEFALDVFEGTWNFLKNFFEEPHFYQYINMTNFCQFNKVLSNIYIYLLLQYQLIMIYKHKFLKQAIIEGKLIRQITQQSPLIVIVEDGQFLHYTLKTALQYLALPHIITPLRQCDLQNSRKNMGHEIPNIIFSNQVLQTAQTIQFLCDAFIDDNDYIDFESRKANIKQLAMTWKQIFIFQKLYPYDFEKLSTLGVRNRKDYLNLILSELQKLATFYHGKLLQKAFKGYAEQPVSLQNILFVDIINTIITRTPQSQIDHKLRSSLFLNLIEIQSKYKRQMLSIGTKHLLSSHKLLLQQPVSNYPTQWEQFRLNASRFVIVFGFMAIMYSIFAKN